MTHQQRVSRSRSGSAVIKRAVGEWRQRPLLAFMPQEGARAQSCCNTLDEM